MRGCVTHAFMGRFAYLLPKINVLKKTSILAGYVTSHSQYLSKYLKKYFYNLKAIRNSSFKEGNTFGLYLLIYL